MDDIIHFMLFTKYDINSVAMNIHILIENSTIFTLNIQILSTWLISAHTVFTWACLNCHTPKNRKSKNSFFPKQITIYLFWRLLQGWFLSRVGLMKLDLFAIALQIQKFFEKHSRVILQCVMNTRLFKCEQTLFFV